jgi:hypothetical protein
VFSEQLLLNWILQQQELGRCSSKAFEQHFISLPTDCFVELNAQHESQSKSQNFNSGFNPFAGMFNKPMTRKEALLILDIPEKYRYFNSFPLLWV